MMHDGFSIGIGFSFGIGDGFRVGLGGGEAAAVFGVETVLSEGRRISPAFALVAAAPGREG